MITLALDASTYTGTVAVVGDGRLLAHARVPMRGEHEERLMPAVADALARARTIGAAGGAGEQVARIVCGGGPGSFTSLRIAASIAKGLATAWECPLYAVPSLALIVGGAEPALPVGTYLAALDALRGESYVAGYAVDAGGAIAEVMPLRLVAHGEVVPVARSLGATVVGPGQAIDVGPDARGVVRLAEAIAATGEVELASWEPDYGRKAEAQVRWEAAHGRPLPLA